MKKIMILLVAVTFVMLTTIGADAGNDQKIAKEIAAQIGISPKVMRAADAFMAKNYPGALPKDRWTADRSGLWKNWKKPGSWSVLKMALYWDGTYEIFGRDPIAQGDWTEWAK